MWNGDEPEIRNTPELRHFLRRRIEGVGDERHRGYSGFLEHDGVEQTARRACPSVSDAGNDKIDVALERRDLFVPERRALRLVQHHFGLDAVQRLELLGELA